MQASASWPIQYAWKNIVPSLHDVTRNRINKHGALLRAPGKHRCRLGWHCFVHSTLWTGLVIKYNGGCLTAAFHFSRFAVSPLCRPQIDQLLTSRLVCQVLKAATAELCHLVHLRACRCLKAGEECWVISPDACLGHLRVYATTLELSAW
jgi:hypothetical protein